MGSLEAARFAIAEQVKFDVLTQSQEAVCSIPSAPYTVKLIC